MIFICDIYYDSLLIKVCTKPYFGFEYFFWLTSLSLQPVNYSKENLILYYLSQEVFVYRIAIQREDVPQRDGRE